jgi:pimeloyl-ACP methyl ester carboxylesterase
MPFAMVAGQSIYYIQQGRQGLPVIFVHGSGSNHLIWGSQVRALGDMAQAIAIDLPGHGRSELPGRTSVNAYADVILGLLDVLHFDRAVVVGHSLGGAIAQTFGLTYPDRTAGLGLVGTGARLRVLPAILQGVLSPADFDTTMQFVIDYSYAPGLDAEMRRRAEEEFRACPPQVTHDDFAACDAFDIMARVSDIRAPTLIICGRQDRLTPIKYAEYLASKIPNARLVLVDGAGHSVMVEQPEAVNAALVDLLHAIER